jgi:transposase
MDRAHEGAKTRELAVSLGCAPVVPPKGNRREPWEYGRELYKKRNEAGRFFRRHRRFRRACARCGKPGRMFPMFFLLTPVHDLLL